MVGGNVSLTSEIGLGSVVLHPPSLPSVRSGLKLSRVLWKVEVEGYDTQGLRY